MNPLPIMPIRSVSIGLLSGTVALALVVVAEYHNAGIRSVTPTACGQRGNHARWTKGQLAPCRQTLSYGRNAFGQEDGIMKTIAIGLIAAAAALAGCTASSPEQSMAPAAGQPLTYPAHNMGEFEAARTEADDYCYKKSDL